MEKSKEIKCLNGHLATQLCSDKDCSHPSLACENKECYIWRNHQGCFSKVSTTFMLEKKGQSFYLNEADPIVTFYQGVIKSFTVALDSYKMSLEIR